MAAPAGLVCAQPLRCEANGKPVNPDSGCDERGRLRQHDVYSAPPAESRERSRLLSRKTWDDTGRLVSDDECFSDGSRKAR